MDKISWNFINTIEYNRMHMIRCDRIYNIILYCFHDGSDYLIVALRRKQLHGIQVHNKLYTFIKYYASVRVTTYASIHPTTQAYCTTP